MDTLKIILSETLEIIFFIISIPLLALAVFFTFLSNKLHEAQTRLCQTSIRSRQVDFEEWEV